MPPKKKRKPKPVHTKKELSRKVLAAFHDHPTQAFNYKRISKKLNVKKETLKKLVEIIMVELADQGSLVNVARGKYKLNYKQEILEGQIDMTGRGAAYVVTDAIEEDIFIPPRSMGTALHKDRVKVGLILTKKGRRLEGEVLEILERHKTEFVGLVQRVNDNGFLVPDDRKMPMDIFLPKVNLKDTEDGCKALVRIVEWPKDSRSPVGKIVEILGKPGENDAEMHAILAEFGLPHRFQKTVLREADQLPKKITAKDISQRRDFRKITTFTIDPHDAKDFDDALSYEVLDNGNVEIGVHIADVSHYLKKGGALDQEAFNRGTSVYLVDRVVPMLPEVLSNEVCSLRPNEEKLCFSAVFELDEQAHVIKEWFGRTIILSDRRFTYEEAQEVIENGKGDYSEAILKLNAMAVKMRERRFNSGAIGFDKMEVKFQLDDDGNPTGVYLKHQKEAHKLIEEFMLLANRRVAELIGKPQPKKKVKPFVYRIHDSPDPEKLRVFSNFISKFGYKVRTGNRGDVSSSFNTLFKQVAGKGEENVIEQMAIRTMAKAVYTTENIGHYGLAFDYYSHFTSPIRRYPDVIVHRLLAHYLDGGAAEDQESLEKKCKHASDMERKATEAERMSIKYKQVQFLEGRIGEEFEGIVSGMNDYGLFVELNDNKCEGMIRLRDMGYDYFVYDEKNLCVTGNRTGEQYFMGDPIKVRLIKADLVKKQIDFELLDY